MTESGKVHSNFTVIIIANFQKLVKHQSLYGIGETVCSRRPAVSNSDIFYYRIGTVSVFVNSISRFFGDFPLFFARFGPENFP